MHTPTWSLFFDFHTMPAVPDVGARFDVEHFTDRIKACGVDYIVFPARCNLGMAYYDTRAGIRHPSLTYDLFGRLVEACGRKGIALTAYINAGLSHEEGLLHRDWTTVTPDGYAYTPQRLNHWVRTMCYNSPYGDHLLTMVNEVVTGYPVAGLFLDCMGMAPCVGGECVREMKTLGMDWDDPQQQREFSHLSRVRMARRISESARAADPDLLLYFNGIPAEDQLDIGSYQEYECLPTGGWGYENLPLYARYTRTLGKPVLNMTGRFHRSWGDFGGLRTEASLEYDCLYGLANGMQPTVGGHAHPRGDNEDAVFDLIEPIYTRLRKLQPWVASATPQTDVAVVMPEQAAREVCLEAHQRALAILRGAVRLLCELKIQFDVVSYARSWDGYAMLVLPDAIVLGEQAAGKIRRHLSSGGTILSSGRSGLDPEHGCFVLSDWGLKFNGQDPHDPAFYVVEPELAEGIPAMPNNFYCAGADIGALPGTRVLARIVAPYFNREWDGEHAFLYLPPDRVTGRPAVTLNGRVAHISHEVFKGYHDAAPVPLKHLVGNLLKLLLPRPLVRASSLPSFARVTVTAQPGRRIIHVLSYVPERRGPNVDMIEEPIELRNVDLALRSDKRAVKRVYLAPESTDLEFEIADGYMQTSIPALSGYAMVVVEE